LLMAANGLDLMTKVTRKGWAMSLPSVSGKGFLISDGVELKFATSGTAYARLPLVFKNTRNVDGNWIHDKEVLIEATVFGPLAEWLAETVTSRAEMYVTGDVYVDEYKTKDGVTKQSLKMTVASAAPVKVREKTGAATGFRSNNDDVPF